eukprot:scaffold127187_cov29-Tisochrysis_lutea.AAC.4
MASALRESSTCETNSQQAVRMRAGRHGTTTQHCMDRIARRRHLPAALLSAQLLGRTSVDSAKDKRGAEA